MRVALTIVAALLGASPSVVASEPKTPVFLEQGKAAPYDGELVESWFLKGLLKTRADLRGARGEMRRLRSDLNKSQGLLALEKAGRQTDADQAARVAQAYEERVAGLEMALLDASKPVDTPFFERPVVVATISGVVAIGLTLLVVEVAR